MTYFITALTNNNARLIESESRTTDEAIKDMIVVALEARGFIVTVRAEG